jgi:hypothetical protein
MPQTNQFLGEERNDSFCSAIELGRNTFKQRSNLCDLHEWVLVGADQHYGQKAAAQENETDQKQIQVFVSRSTGHVWRDFGLAARDDRKAVMGSPSIP